MTMLATYLWVALGSALGGMARFWLTGAIAGLTGTVLPAGFPWGTLLINVLGSFVIGATAGLTLPPERLPLATDIRIFIMVGLCGGFTTFSAFSLQTLELLQAGQQARAAVYAAGSGILCVFLTWVGWRLARL